MPLKDEKGSTSFLMGRKSTEFAETRNSSNSILLNLGTDLFSKMKPGYVTQNFNKICRRVGLNGFKLQGTRHTFATKLIDTDVDVLTVSRILGHSDINTTMSYAKVRHDPMQNAVRLLKIG